MTVWPETGNTWTNAAVLMAADAIYHLTPASRLFSHRVWSGREEGFGLRSLVSPAKGD
jgi:hypothetical protein